MVGVLLRTGVTQKCQRAKSLLKVTSLSGTDKQTAFSVTAFRELSDPWVDIGHCRINL